MIAKLISSTKAAFALPIIIFLLDFVALRFWQQIISLGIINEISATLHFMGGVAMAVIFFNFWEKKPALYSFKRKLAVNLILVMGFVALTGVVWELFEFGSDFALPRFLGDLPGRFQPSLSDTMADLTWDLVGSAVIALAYFKSSLYKVPEERM